MSHHEPDIVAGKRSTADAHEDERHSKRARFDPIPGGQPSPLSPMGSPAYTNLRGANQEDWHKLLSERGVEEHTADGQKVYLTRRGSFMLQHENADGTHDIAILHSVRTANLIAKREAFAAKVDETAAASKRPPRGEERANRYREPVYPAATSGHIVEVTQFSGTAQGGFRALELLPRTHGSGKAPSPHKGDFSVSRMAPLHKAGWPRGRPTDIHHSETDFAASQRQRPAMPPEGGLLVHQMTGVNDMCTYCREGVSRVLVPERSASFVSYTSRHPFGTGGEWLKVSAPSAVGPGKIVRGRPEEMMHAYQHDHVDRAKSMVDLRNRVRGIQPPTLGGGPGRTPPQPPPPPPPSAAAAAASSSGSSGGSSWTRVLGGRLVST